MFIFFEQGTGDGYIIFKDNKIVGTRASRNPMLSSIFLKLRRKGIPKTIEYECKGKKRRRTIYKTIKDEEQILEYLQSISEKHGIHSILTVDDDRSESKYKEVDNVIDIAKYKLKRYLGMNRSLREFSNRYEYCLLKEYEEQFEEFQCHSIFLGGVFAQILILKNMILLVSIEFSKDIYSLKKIVSWLDKYNIVLIISNNINFIEKARELKEAVLFQGIPIILYEKGSKVIDFDTRDFIEVTNSFIVSKQVVDTSESKIIT